MTPVPEKCDGEPVPEYGLDPPYNLEPDPLLPSE